MTDICRICRESPAIRKGDRYGRRPVKRREADMDICGGCNALLIVGGIALGLAALEKCLGTNVLEGPI